MMTIESLQSEWTITLKLHNSAEPVLAAGSCQGSHQVSKLNLVSIRYHLDTKKTVNKIPLDTNFASI